MDALRHPVIVHTRLVLLWYAAAVGALGVAMLAGGSRLFWAGSGGTGWMEPATVRLFGAVAVAAACAAVALSRAEDVDSRRRSVLWFVVGHSVVFVAVVVQPGPNEFPPLLEGSLVASIMILGYACQVGDGQPERAWEPPTTLFGRAGNVATVHLRSAYERQIRRAAGQEERARLARDLHDSVKQHLFVVQTAAATTEVRLDADVPGARSALAEIRKAAREALAEMDAMLHGLRAAPFENTGLVAALKQQCEALGFRTGAEVIVTVGDLPPSEALPPGTHEAVFRVAQEALANVARHARAGHVRVALTSANGDLELAVEDDGVGCASEDRTRGVGLSNMRARAEDVGGTLDVTPRTGGGTRVALRVPSATFEPADLREYRRRAIGWGAVLVMLAATGISRGEWVAHAAIAMFVAILFGRDFLAYRRAARAIRRAR